MLSFLLDEQISPEIARQIQSKYVEIPIFSIYDWENGNYLGVLDEQILEAAANANLTLVTYDQNTIPPILVDWGQIGKNHTGIIFIDYLSLPPNNFGGLVRAITWLWKTENNSSWQNRIIYLKPDK